MLKRLLPAVLAFLATLATLAPAQAAPIQPPGVAARAWLVADVSSGQVLASERADERFEPASLTKLMTAYLTFSALRDRKITLEQTIEVSERAWKAPGSRMFIQPGRPVVVDELIRGMVVQSGNDACVALAELIAGTEEVFAQRMTAQAERLGMKNTRFMNASGLPDPQHYSTARDLYLLAAALIRDFPAEYARYYSQKEFRYNNINQLNRNRLLWIDPTVDGVKTGYTEAAGYCLVSSSKRGDRRVLSVVLGTASESVRAQESLKLLNWGHLNFDAVKLYEAGGTAKTIEVWKGVAKTVKAGFESDLMLIVPKGDAARVKAELSSEQPLVAPVQKGQRLGTLHVTLEGNKLGEYPLIALEPVAAAGFFGRAWDTLRLWAK